MPISYSRTGPCGRHSGGIPTSPPQIRRKAKNKRKEETPRHPQTKEKVRLVSSTPTPPSPLEWARPPSRPPPRLPTPPGRPGSYPREFRAPQSPSSPAVAGMVTSIPWQRRGHPVWQHRHPPMPHGVPRSWRISLPRVGTGGLFPLGTPRRGTGDRSRRGPSRRWST